jgi:hypothetical protein
MLHPSSSATCSVRSIGLKFLGLTFAFGGAHVTLLSALGGRRLQVKVRFTDRRLPQITTWDILTSSLGTERQSRAPASLEPRGLSSNHPLVRSTNQAALPDLLY